VYVGLEALIRLQYEASGFSFLPRQPVHSLLAGHRASRLRGRGLDFEELRCYLPGDDIRTIDWKVTNRTKKPHVRVYTEERERPVLVIVDQRLSMFYGTQVNMKSVTAAETAALACWRVVAAGDRVGAIAFNDLEVREVRPQRSRKTVMQILDIIVKQNNALGVNRGIVENPGMLNHVLERTVHIAKHDYLVCIISDFSGMTDATRRLIKRLSRHNDVILAALYDPSARQLPRTGKFVVSDGQRQLEIDPGSAKLRQRYPELRMGRLSELTEQLAKYGVPVLPIHTAEKVAIQIRDALGRVPGKQGRAPQRPAMRGSR
jgi:uncharacterized protein (DUF58 family)